ncbi:MAG: hypothetical protein RLZZ341_1682, partial [Pseudomonadota bacterium]
NAQQVAGVRADRELPVVWAVARGSLVTVSGQSLGTQAAVLAAIARVMTVGVYGLVAGIVKLDDAGLWLSRRPGAAAQAAGRAVLRAAPWLMKALSVASTLAEALVGVAVGAVVLAVVLAVSRLRGRP